MDRNTVAPALKTRLDEIGLALLMILTGSVLLLPDQLPSGSWLIGVGVIVLGMDVVRFLVGITVSGFSLIVGAIALSCGFSSASGVDLPVFAAMFLVLGFVLLFRALFQKGELTSLPTK